MRISDLIAQYIEEEIQRSSGSVHLSRSELADRFSCVPSQINYVLSTRFSPEHGYCVDSRRGGGGYIRITRVKMTRGQLLMHVINTVGNSIDSASAAAFISNMNSNDILSESEARLITAATSDYALASADKSQRDVLRASILKRCLLVLQ
ncbi:MAG: CtsR family transcriptional regulator [Ruminococcaceae bacterium]|nr:CtsR family transcriptional regulator [Oscillospiraceae bacterium]